MTEGSVQKQMLEEMRELNAWMKLRSRSSLKETIEDLDAVDQIIIDEADGETSVRELAASANLASTPSHRLRKLSRMGVVRKNDSGKWLSLADLQELGIDRPEREENND